MANRQRLLDNMNRRAARILNQFADDVREGRLLAGLTQAELAKTLGISTSQVSRAERARSPNLSLATATRMAGLVGLDLSVRCYPSAGRGLRDAAHQVPPATR